MIEITVRKYLFNFSLRAISKDNEKIMNRNGRYFLSHKFKEFEKNLSALVKMQLPRDFKRFEKENLAVTLNYNFKNRKHCDIFNLPKSTLDAMNGILWKDDRQIKSGSVDVNYGDKEEIQLEVFNLE